MLAPLYLPESKQNLLSELTQGLDPNALNWLSGYLAGIAQNIEPGQFPVPAPVAAPALAPRQSLTILYGSQTGNAQRLATALADRKIGRAWCRERVCKYVYSPVGAGS